MTHRRTNIHLKAPTRSSKRPRNREPSLTWECEDGPIPSEDDNDGPGNEPNSLEHDSEENAVVMLPPLKNIRSTTWPCLSIRFPSFSACSSCSTASILPLKVFWA